MNKIFETAIDQLKNGWVKGTMDDGCGNICLNMALALGIGITGKEKGDEIFCLIDNSSAGKVVAQIITEQFPDRGYLFFNYKFSSGQIYKFNDAEQTTLPEVIAVLEKANAKMEEYYGC